MSAAAAVGGASTAIDPAREPTITPHEQKHYVGCKKPLKFPTAEAERDWARTQTKTCSKCHETLPRSYFLRNTSGTDAFDRHGYRRIRPECSTCYRIASKGKSAATATAKRLGMSTKAPEGTPCEVCGVTEKIVFDHYHDTDTFRGWLCDPCNRSTGVLGDNVAGIVKVLNYLNRTEKRVLKVDSSGQLVLAE